MKRVTWLVLGVLVGGGLVFGSLRYHVLRTGDGLVLIPKAVATFDGTYLDVRGWGLSNWSQHQEVAQAVIAADREELLVDAAGESFQQGMSGLIDRFRK